MPSVQQRLDGSRPHTQQRENFIQRVQAPSSDVVSPRGRSLGSSTMSRPRMTRPRSSMRRTLSDPRCPHWLPLRKPAIPAPIKKPSTSRGIAPELLVSQVRSTMPYLFAPEGDGDSITLPPAELVRAYQDGMPLSHFEYFRLCVCCHYLSCATPVPTDVDNQIRFKLWPSGLPLVTALEMGTFVLRSHDWPFAQISSRTSGGAVGTPFEHELLHGHFGEWFTVASAAYAALGAYRAADAKALREQLLEAMTQEISRHAEIFGSLWRAKDGVGALLASASIAHNFGDLDRVMDMWKLPIEDPLRLRYYKLTTSPFDPDKRLRFEGRLWGAGELYKSVIEGSSMALENHRHFALRKPRVIRSLPSLRIPLAPFFDAWGHEVAKLEGEPLDEVVVSLVEGWERLNKTVAYVRALHSIAEVHPGLLGHACVKEALKSARFRSVLEMPQDAFEAKWASAAVEHLDDIPSRV